jgi:hypothetical protein
MFTKNTATVKACEDLEAVIWTSEVYTVGNTVRVDLLRNGAEWGTGIAPADVRSAVMCCTRSQKSAATIAKKLTKA